MPRITELNKQYKVSDIGSWVYGQLKKSNKTQKDLAIALDTTQQAVSKKIKSNSFSYSDLLTIFEFLETPDFEILRLMKI